MCGSRCVSGGGRGSRSAAARRAGEDCLTRAPRTSGWWKGSSLRRGCRIISSLRRIPCTLFVRLGIQVAFSWWIIFSSRVDVTPFSAIMPRCAGCGVSGLPRWARLFCWPIERRCDMAMQMWLALPPPLPPRRWRGQRETIPYMWAFQLHLAGPPPRVRFQRVGDRRHLR